MIKSWDYSQPFINFRSEKMKKLFNVLSILLLITLLISCGKKDDYKLSIVAPSGAPAIAIANIAYNQKDDYSLEINKTADVLQASFLAAEKDIIIAPINLGATMYNKNGNYVFEENTKELELWYVWLPCDEEDIVEKTCSLKDLTEDVLREVFADDDVDYKLTIVR